MTHDQPPNTIDAAADDDDGDHHHHHHHHNNKHHHHHHHNNNNNNNNNHNNNNNIIITTTIIINIIINNKSHNSHIWHCQSELDLKFAVSLYHISIFGYMCLPSQTEHSAHHHEMFCELQAMNTTDHDHEFNRRHVQVERIPQDPAWGVGEMMWPSKC